MFPRTRRSSDRASRENHSLHLQHPWHQSSGAKGLSLEMNSVVSNAAGPSSSVLVCLEEQSALVRSGDYWNCLKAARELAALLLAEGRRPWIARLRKTEVAGEQTFHAPLIPRVPGVTATWTTHYVCCCDDLAYDPVAGRLIRLEAYSREIFGEHLSTEVFVSTDKLPAYLATDLVPEDFTDGN